jgi:NAD(P)H-hydrate repair Nnr-like enzyme with NAD(P)H-hydrate epimerase domain
MAIQILDQHPASSTQVNLIVDAIFGFSWTVQCDPQTIETHGKDSAVCFHRYISSGWDVEKGPPSIPECIISFPGSYCNGKMVLKWTMKKIKITMFNGHRMMP